MKRYIIDAAIMAGVFCLGLLALESYHTWQRVNVLWAWANDQNMRAQQAQQMPHAPAPTETPKKP